MKKPKHRVAAKTKFNGKPDEQELKIAAKILEWEIGDIWGHVGVRMPDKEGIAVQMFRRPEEQGKEEIGRAHV